MILSFPSVNYLNELLFQLILAEINPQHIRRFIYLIS